MSSSTASQTSSGMRFGHPLGILSLLLGVLGVWLIVDATWFSEGGSARHRLAGQVGGALLSAPILAWSVPRLRRWVARLALACVATVGIVILIELFVRVFDVQAIRAPQVRDDPRLGVQLVGGTGQTDALGFRNRAVPDRADCVCIGDSQTYGHGVTESEAFPAQLAERAGRTVYNMALGTYGAVQYLELVERARPFAPSDVVIGLYLGNDMLNAHQAVSLDAWAALRDPAFGDYPAFQFPVFESEPPPNLTMAAVEYAVDKSFVLGWCIHVLRMQARQTAFLADTYRSEPGAPEWREGEIRTLLTPARRLPAVDLDRAPVRDGLRITLECLRRSAAIAESYGARLTVLLLHTKEFHYSSLFAERNAAAPSAGPVTMDDLRRNEVELTSRLVTASAADGYRVVDSGPEIDRALRADRPMWPAHSDGHYSAGGHALLAEVLQQHLLLDRDR